jgi:hypothetical protein
MESLRSGLVEGARVPTSNRPRETPGPAHIFQFWIDGWNKLGLDRTHTVPRVTGYVMLALSLPVGLLMNHFVRVAGESDETGLFVSLPAAYVAMLNRVAEEPLGTSLPDSFWIGMAVLLPGWLLFRGAGIAVRWLSRLSQP